MVYRVCKSFEFESGHMLSKHPGFCRFPHGHSRRVEVVLSARDLDPGDMVCDFKVLSLALRDFLAQFDHAMAVNSKDPSVQGLRASGARVVVFEETDPTTEVMARRIFEFLDAQIAAGETYVDDRSPGSSGVTYRFPRGVTLERVRLSETSSTWAEYARA